jgi:hypothetical protein
LGFFLPEATLSLDLPMVGWLVEWRWWWSVLVVWVGRDVLVWGWGRRAASRSSRRMPAHQYLTIQWVLVGAASHPSTTDGRSIDQPRGAAVQSGDELPA